MASQRLTSLPNNSTMAAGDLFYHVDVSDTTDGVAGTSKSVPWSGILSSITLTANDWSAAQRFNSTGFSIKADGGGAYYANLRIGGPATADRVLTINMPDANATLAVGAAASVSGTNTGDQFTSIGSLSVVGNGTNAAAAAGVISAGGDGTVLRRSGTTLAFGQVDLANSLAVTGILPAANLPVMVAAGGSHAKGAAPDPGATAHANDHYFLRDSGVWTRQAGQYLGHYFVATDESTNSTAIAHLATIERVDFTVDVACTVLVFWRANVYSASAAADLITTMCLDGAVVSGAISSVSLPLGYTSDVVICVPLILAAGAHYVYTVKQVNTSACFGHWRQRMLSVHRVN